jgi:UDP-N-acetylmuramoyl-tripeptide--D-alanyl-D-alanine ligase
VHWTPETLATAAGGRLLRRGAADGRAIAGVFIDSRTPVAGGVFVPIVAARDGHEFIPAAIAGGAAAVLCQSGRAPADASCTVVEVDDTLRALHALARAARDRVTGPVVAVTGSNGKTTTRAMIDAVLRTRYPRLLATLGNFNNHLGVPLMLLNGPDDADAAVLELGMSAPGENALLGQIVRPDVAVITSVALEHLEFMGSLEAIAAAEAEVVAYLKPGGVVVLPADEPLLDAHVPAGVRALRFGTEAGTAVQIVGVEQDERTHLTLRLHHRAGGEEVRVGLAVFGGHNARNAAAALAVGLELGCPVPAMLEALAQVQPVGDRGRVLAFGPHLLIADCYNANPGSMAAALRSLVGLRGKRTGPLVAVLGDMLELGPTAPQLHAELGALVAELGIDALFTFGSLTQHAAEVARARGIAAWHAGENVNDAVAAVRARFGRKPGAVLVKGSRGMRLERVVAALADAPVGDPSQAGDV